MDQNEVAATVRRAAAGDRTAWDALVDSFSSMVWAVTSGYRLGRADTAEVVQTTWLRLVEHLDRIKQPEAVGAWLATTARREALRMLKLRGREIITDDESQLSRDDARDQFPSPEAHVLTADRNRRLWAAFERLPDKCRALLRLLMVGEPPYAEVAATLHMPIGSIGPTRARCLERLRRLLGDDGPTDLSGVSEVNPTPERDDDALLTELGEVLRMYDQPPADVIAAAKELFTWRTVDAELAALTFDSLLDDEPAVVRSTDVAPRVLTFETDDVTVELEVEDRPSGRRLLGQLVPAGAAVVVLTAGGHRAETTADELGSFVALLPDLPGRVVLTVTPHGARAVSVVAVV